MILDFDVAFGFIIIMLLVSCKTKDFLLLPAFTVAIDVSSGV